MSPERTDEPRGSAEQQPSAEQQLTAALQRLPERDIDPWRAERIRRRAHAALARQRALAQRPWLFATFRLYERVLEPAFVLSVTAVYLGWAVLAVQRLLAP